MLIRTWNVFHGNTSPPQRRAFLEDTVAARRSADEPDVVCLQELPLVAAAARRLERDTGGRPALAQPPSLGPLPSTPTIGRAITSLHQGLLRSAFSGQGERDPRLAPARALRDAARLHVLNPRQLPARADASGSGSGSLARLAWAKERRVCQAVRVWDGEPRRSLVANLHATSYPPDQRLADAELLRAFVYVDGLAQPGEPVAVAGDFNVTLRALAHAAGHHADGVGLLAAGAGHRPRPRARPRASSRARRGGRSSGASCGGAVLSDHAPVDVVVE